ncbi:bifunctional phosphopantothenoylcysteine decarboxylase/phosphopantothenate--cysteine ligase CoaBC [Chromobacterium sp. ATCC 53434]|uniref:bifunctional phosphopantothenoylcysteine decarboxylase/phosphopantothenate--cysteine ligase CoaBC n=1 Tax=Chromobacterium sp. (strain ATCC 53434 / SC 14030) TaxID=2059672 RepID=UPI000C778CA9|nr:bifunctional phosphopantothenoylcysteine decarboxylase/phosphopantothenate--cysteine ligase CoaBC [Chromobacterium sp. ATCC 53434]AUH50404.1 bifunctional phosphopantothenoylcysteine decarboxylase/phosphopantothenate--cysteine ligase CoaBC [Chromobacterium sp. ATCC 53434]
MSAKRILLGIGGGIAAYKSAELTRQLIKAGHQVEVVMTEAATRFVTPATFQALTGHTVYTDLWDPRPSNAMAHIELSRRADVFLIAPATADLLFKLAHGACDDLVSTLAAARACPLAVAPAMNLQMWQNPPNQRNIAQLEADGVAVLGPGNGFQACGETGDGRMLEPQQIVELLQGLFAAKLLAGKQVLLTAGPTYEAIDAVRGITNISSGKMGYALARACRDAGAEVTLVSGPTGFEAPLNVRRIAVQSAAEMQQAVLAEVGRSDVFISVAAVADYRVKNRSEHKIKKGAAAPVIELEENPDILATVANLPAAPFCVGFAAESQNLLEFAEAKRRRKKLPLLVANLAQQAMGADDNQVLLLDDAGQHPLPSMPKDEVAAAIVRHLAALLAKR